MANGSTAETLLQKYRADLVNQYGKATEEYDKAIMTLSGGALGISFLERTNNADNARAQHLAVGMVAEGSLLDRGHRALRTRLLAWSLLVKCYDATMF